MVDRPAAAAADGRAGSPYVPPGATNGSRRTPDGRPRRCPGSTLTTLAEDLASRGYVVAAVDHAYEERRDVLVLTEGVLTYLDPAGLRSFLVSCRTAFPAAELVADHFHPRIALSGLHPIVKATGARFRSGARGGRGLAAAAPGWKKVSDHRVMERISLGHRAAGGLFRLLALGAPAYSVARLRAAPPAG